jgi:hypothetical protein
MVKPPAKSRLTTTIDADLLTSFKVFAAHEGKRLNQLLEEGIRYILEKHESKSPAPTTISVPKQDRREHSRVEVTWPVSIFTSRGLVEGEIKDISKGGALIHCSQLPETDQSLELKIDIPDHLLNISAKVEKVRLNIDDTDQAFPSYDLAVRFLGINVDQRRDLFKAIEHKAHGLK